MGIGITFKFRDQTEINFKFRDQTEIKLKKIKLNIFLKRWLLLDSLD